jgi:hypothetical protein
MNTYYFDANTSKQYLFVDYENMKFKLAKQNLERFTSHRPQPRPSTTIVGLLAVIIFFSVPLLALVFFEWLHRLLSAAPSEIIPDTSIKTFKEVTKVTDTLDISLSDPENVLIALEPGFSTQSVSAERFSRSLPEFVDYLLEFIPFPSWELPIPPGKSRVRWKCVCISRIPEDKSC